MNEPGFAPRYALFLRETIYSGGEPYLKKLYLIRCPLFQVTLHWILKADPDRDLHDHPRDFVSIILRGRYFERFTNRQVYRKAPSVAFRRAETLHRISGVDVRRNTLTLVLWGRKRREWGFMTPNGWKHWRTYCGVENPPPPGRTVNQVCVQSGNGNVSVQIGGGQ